MSTSYDIGVRNVLWTLGSQHSYVFRGDKEIQDVKRAKGYGLCAETSHSRDTSIKHIMEETGISTHGPYVHRRGLKLTKKGVHELSKLVVE